MTNTWEEVPLACDPFFCALFRMECTILSHSIGSRSNLGRQVTFPTKMRQAVEYWVRWKTFQESQALGEWSRGAPLLKAITQPIPAHCLFLPVHGAHRWAGAHSLGGPSTEKIGEHSRLKIQLFFIFFFYFFFPIICSSLFGCHGYTNTSAGTFVTAMWRWVLRSEKPPEEEGQQQPPGLAPTLQEAAPAAVLGQHPTAGQTIAQVNGEANVYLSVCFERKYKKKFKKEKPMLLTRQLGPLPPAMLVFPYSGPMGGHRVLSLFPRSEASQPWQC